MKDGKRVMRDARLNIETYDLRYRDRIDGTLPGKLVKHRLVAARSAPIPCRCRHDLSAQGVKRNKSTIWAGAWSRRSNASSKQFRAAARQQVWLNALWDGKQMLYGQDCSTADCARWRHRLSRGRMSCSTASPGARHG